MILVKRLESSFYAFKCSIDRFIESHKKFIDIYQNDKVVSYGSNQEIFRYLENEEENKILKLIENQKTIEINSNQLKDSFIIDINDDKEILEQIKELWTPINIEPKLDAILNRFDRVIKRKNKNTKIIVFTESEETTQMLENRLKDKFKVLKYSGKSKDNDKRIVEENFDPNSIIKKDDINILITTDVLAEGVNLHRSNIILNYDLPWNPTKILQRSGRINRIGTTFNKIHIYNCFPTSISDEELGLKQNIQNKIQAFHNVLGSDAKLLTEDEELGNSKELFGKILIDKIDNCVSDSENIIDDENNDLEYCNIIREIKENNKQLYNKIKNLPKQCRTATTFKGNNDKLITFFRKGYNIPKFISSDDDKEEIGFYEAIKMFKCSPNKIKKNIPQSFFNLIKKNKENFKIFEAQETNINFTQSNKGHSNEKKLMNFIRYVKQELNKHNNNLYYVVNQEDKELILSIETALNDGIIPKPDIANVLKQLQSQNDIDKIISILKNNLNIDEYLKYSTKSSNKKLKSSNIEEIILSEYFYKE